MKLRHFRYFAAVAEEKSMLSRQLHEQETEVGAKLRSGYPQAIGAPFLWIVVITVLRRAGPEMFSWTAV
jgi:hypothetical protein